MDLLTSFINASACGLISLVLVGAILSPRVHDGIVIKIGLIAMAAGFGAMALRFVDGIQPDDLVGVQRALLLINAGIAVVIIGYVMRRSRVAHPLARVTDWAKFDEAPR